MDERGWLESGAWLDLWFHSDEVGLRRERKTRLFAAAVCRRFAHRLVDPRCLRAVEVNELYADGLADEDTLEAALDGAVFDTEPPVAGQSTAVGRAAAAATHWICYTEYKVGRSAEAAPGVHAVEALIAAGVLAESASPEALSSHRGHPAYREGLARGERIQADILREVIGNPFRIADLDPSCRTPAVAALARAAYDERRLPSGELDPERLAVLADALEDAGAVGDILAHLRGLGPHVRGCWALDLALGYPLRLPTDIPDPMGNS